MNMDEHASIFTFPLTFSDKNVLWTYCACHGEGLMFTHDDESGVIWIERFWTEFARRSFWQRVRMAVRVLRGKTWNEVVLHPESIEPLVRWLSKRRKTTGSRKP